MAFEKYERDGKIAVLISPGFGAGWSTWFDGDQQQAAMDRRLVEHVLAGGKIDQEITAEVFGPDDHRYIGGGGNVEVEWVEKGKHFYIHEYDGNERIVSDADLIWTA